MIKRFFITIIRLYQLILSPEKRVWSSHKRLICKFYPSCSDYAIEAIERHGTFQGLLQAGWRVLRCNPWQKGGIDHVL
jgi:uncharacterized protein